MLLLKFFGIFILILLTLYYAEGVDKGKGKAEGFGGVGEVGDVAKGVAGKLVGDAAGKAAGDVTRKVAREVVGNVAGESAGEVAGDFAGKVAEKVARTVTGKFSGRVAGIFAEKAAQENLKVIGKAKEKSEGSGKAALEWGNELGRRKWGDEVEGVAEEDVDDKKSGKSEGSNVNEQQKVMTEEKGMSYAQALLSNKPSVTKPTMANRNIGKLPIPYQGGRVSNQPTRNKAAPKTNTTTKPAGVEEKRHQEIYSQSSKGRLAVSGSTESKGAISEAILPRPTYPPYNSQAQYQRAGFSNQPPQTNQRGKYHPTRDYYRNQIPNNQNKNPHYNQNKNFWGSERGVQIQNSSQATPRTTATKPEGVEDKHQKELYIPPKRQSVGQVKDSQSVGSRPIESKDAVSDAILPNPNHPPTHPPQDILDKRQKENYSQSKGQSADSESIESKVSEAIHPKQNHPPKNPPGKDNPVRGNIIAVANSSLKEADLNETVKKEEDKEETSSPLNKVQIEQKPLETTKMEEVKPAEEQTGEGATLMIGSIKTNIPMEKIKNRNSGGSFTSGSSTNEGEKELEKEEKGKEEEIISSETGSVETQSSIIDIPRNDLNSVVQQQRGKYHSGSSSHQPSNISHLHYPRSDEQSFYPSQNFGTSSFGTHIPQSNLNFSAEPFDPVPAHHMNLEDFDASSSSSDYSSSYNPSTELIKEHGLLVNANIKYSVPDPNKRSKPKMLDGNAPLFVPKAVEEAMRINTLLENQGFMQPSYEYETDDYSIAVPNQNFQMPQNTGYPNPLHTFNNQVTNHHIHDNQIHSAYSPMNFQQASPQGIYQAGSSTHHPSNSHLHNPTSPQLDGYGTQFFDPTQNSNTMTFQQQISPQGIYQGDSFLQGHHHLHHPTIHHSDGYTQNPNPMSFQQPTGTPGPFVQGTGHDYTSKLHHNLMPLHPSTTYHAGSTSHNPKTENTPEQKGTGVFLPTQEDFNATYEANYDVDSDEEKSDEENIVE
ncbi:hypothetical protein ACQ4LE_005948 [Meloidogyne hapla]